MQLRHRLAFLGCSFSIGVFSGFNNFTLSLWLFGLTESLLLIALLANTRGFLGSIVSPITGAWSDHVWAGWLGRRRPFILAGGLLSAVLIMFTPTVSRWPMPEALDWLPPSIFLLLPTITILFLITVAFNAMDDIHKALLPDLTTGASRNRLASLMVVTDMGGQVGILVLGFMISRNGIPDSAFAITGTLVALGVLITVFGVREPEPALWEAARRVEEAVAGPRLTLRTVLHHYRGAAIFCLVAFAYWFGVNAVLPLVSIYTRQILGASDAEAQLLPALLLLSTTLLAIPMGLLGTRFGKRRVIAGGYVVMGFAALLGLIITTKEQGAIVFLLAGVGNAASMVLTIPLLADLVPRHHMGAAAGILAASGGIAAPLSSIVAGSLADAYGPRAIFAVMAVMICIALLLLSAVRQPTMLAEGTVLAREYV